MSWFATWGVLALFCLGAAEAAGHAQDPVVTYRREDRTLEALAADAAPAADAARRWLPFVRDAGYRLVLADDQKVLLLLSPSYARRVPKKEHHEVEVLLGLARDTVAAAAPFAPPPEGDPLVVIGVRTADYQRLLAQLVTIDPRLRDWADGAGNAANGFILSEPLAAAWIEDPAGVDEWQPDNEFVHRTAQLLVRRCAPKLPDWLMLGLGWHVEDAVLRSVYCFPHRTGFVAEAEHTDWGLCLANNFKSSRRKKDGKPPTLGIEEFADWRPGAGCDEFSSGRAYVAFGVARYLAQEHADAVQTLARKLDAAIEKGSKVWISELEWRTNTGYRVPTGEQLALLQEIVADPLAKVTDYFQKKKANERRIPVKKR